jgi:hypothetical protein
LYSLHIYVYIYIYCYQVLYLLKYDMHALIKSFLSFDT